MKQILTISPDNANGCTYHRILVPAHHLKNHVVTLADNLDNVTDADLKTFDLVWFSRFFGIVDELKQIERLKKFNIPYVIDIDDYWIPYSTHLNYKALIKENGIERLRNLIRCAAGVITTTDYLAKFVSMINKNVIVAPNAIDATQPQFLNSGVNVDRMVFGWIGGVHHFEDLLIIRDSLKQIQDENNISLAMGGYTDTDMYNIFERWFKGQNYDKYLRIDASDVFNYGFQYDKIDVTFVPLANNKFNNCKSQLKAIEAAFKGKAIIASNVMPYTIDLNENNSLLVGEKMFDFYKAIKKLNDNPNLAFDLAAQLTEDLTKKYSIQETISLRDQFFDYI